MKKFLFLFFYFPTFLFSTPIIIQYSTDQGLSDNFVYSIVSVKGKLWVGTDFGLNLYDGETYTHFYKKNGFGTNYFTSLYKCNDTTLLVGNYGGGVYVINTRTKKITSLPVLKNAKTIEVYYRSNGEIWFLSKDLGLVKIYNNICIIFHPSSILRSSKMRPVFFELKNGSFGIGTEFGILLFTGSEFKLWGSWDHLTGVYFNETEKSLYFTRGNVLYTCTTLHNIHPISKLNMDELSYKYICTNQLGQVTIVDQKGEMEIIDFKNEQSFNFKTNTGINGINGTYIDENGYKYITTTSGGYYKIFNHIFSVDTSLVNNQTIHQNDLLLKNYYWEHNELFSINENLKINKYHFFQDLDFLSTLYVYDIKRTSHDIFILVGFNLIKISLNDFKVKLIAQNCYTRSLILYKSRLIFCTQYGIEYYDIHSGQVTMGSKTPYFSRSTCVKTERLQNGMFCMLTNKSLLGLDLRTDKMRLFTIMNMHANDVLYDSLRNTLWIATDDGLYNSHFEFYPLKDSENNSLQVKSMFFDSWNLWFITNNGIYVMGPDKFIWPLKTLNTVMSNNVEYIHSITTKTILLTSQNRDFILTIPDTSTFKNGRLDLKKISEKSSKLSSLRSDIQFTLSLTGINEDIPYYIEYAIDDDKNWKFTSDHLIEANHLWSGKHVVHLRVKTLNSKIILYKDYFFKVAPPKYLNIRSVLVFFIIAFIVIYVIIRLRLNSIHKKHRKEVEQLNQIQELEQHTLSVMMNPHFIFNALNTLQYFIVTKDSMRASNYLTSFSKIVRKTLEIAFQKKVLLSEEIELLEKYLQIENIRLMGNLNYKINMDIALSELIFIPPFMIQPFVENAIKHGITPKGKGNITISIHKKDEDILITVTDDGIGLKKTTANEHNHESMAISIIQKRLAIFNEKYGGNYKVSFDSVNGEGTSVTINLPII